MCFSAVSAGHTVFFLEQTVTAHSVLLSEITGKCLFFQEHYVTSIWDIGVSAEATETQSGLVLLTYVALVTFAEWKLCKLDYF